MTAPDTIGRRALNRATLHRQLFLGRVAMPALDAVDHLVGLQAQVPSVPYLGLRTRPGVGSTSRRASATRRGCSAPLRRSGSRLRTLLEHTQLLAHHHQVTPGQAAIGAELVEATRNQLRLVKDAEDEPRPEIWKLVRW